MRGGTSFDLGDWSRVGRWEVIGFERLTQVVDLGEGKQHINPNFAQ